jgi:PAS domain S-box-containing protein
MIQSVQASQVGGELLASISILEVLPTVQQKVEFADRAIKTVMGIDNSGFCIREYNPSTPIDPACQSCRIKNEINRDTPFDCPLKQSKNHRLVPILTSESFLGYFIVPAGPVELSYLNEQLLLNFLTILSISIDNLLKHRDLEHLNDSLKKSDKQTQTMLDSISDAFFSLDNDFVVTYFNQAAEKALGKKRDEAIGCKLFDVFSEARGSVFEEKYTLALKEKIYISFETYFGVSPYENWYDVRVYPHAEGISVYFQLITDRKNATAELHLKNDELSKTIAEKDKFFSIIAHDLRGPFSSFLGFTQIMAEELPTLTLYQIQKIAVNMRKSASNLYDLLENLLEWSRLQRGMMTFDPLVFPLMSKISESMSLVIDLANQKEITIHYEIPDDREVYADENMFGTIIRNLASNAVKFTPRGGKINLSAKRLNENSVEISVKDTGIGMSGERIANLFRLDNFTNRKGTEGEPSTGLGLIICKEFVEKHGGKLLVKSEEGKGSTFIFTLPAKELTREQ